MSALNNKCRRFITVAKKSKTQQVLDIARQLKVIRTRDLTRRGIPPIYLRRLYQRGLLQQFSRGLYVLPESDQTEHHHLAQACKRVPQGVVCLLSALRFHGLTTQAPFEIWLAIDQKSRAPKKGHPPIRIVRMSGITLKSGVEQHTIENVPVRVFGQAKTVADCFKFRNKIGLDVALEALRGYRRKHRGGMDELWRYAKICRVTAVMRPYLEATA